MTAKTFPRSTMTRRRFKPARLMCGMCLVAASSLAGAQEPVPTTGDNATVTYPAAYFAPFEHYSVNDMLDRIPGITLAGGGGGGGGGGGPGSSGGSDQGCLGAGGDGSQRGVPERDQHGFSDMLCRPCIARSQPEVGGAY